MKYLLDTHSLLWITTDDPKLSKKAKKIYLDAENEILLSIASIWELAIKSSIGKITFQKDLDNFVDVHIKGNNIEILKIELPHVLRIEKLPFHHRDPFDRLIIAQAIEDNLKILGADSAFDNYKVKRIW
jgi:PIN domain nuclease of toxin-antitoxin system